MVFSLQNASVTLLKLQQQKQPGINCTIRRGKRDADGKKSCGWSRLHCEGLIWTIKVWASPLSAECFSPWLGSCFIEDCLWIPAPAERDAASVLPRKRSWLQPPLSLPRPTLMFFSRIKENFNQFYPITLSDLWERKGSSSFCAVITTKVLMRTDGICLAPFTLRLC